MWGIHMIKIFVSSTFKDMDYERDILHDEIVPELNEYASQYGAVSYTHLTLPTILLV